MHASNYIYNHGDKELHGFLAFDDSNDAVRPAVLIAPDWSGRNEFACQKAQLLAEMGYVGFALDMYGEARLGTDNEQKMALMLPLANDRTFLRARVKAAFDTLASIPQVDKNRIAIIGFCFGGLCALDLVRSGADIKAVVSFHGLLGTPEDLKCKPTQAKVLVLHGYDDPMVKPDLVNSFCQEMTEAKADWQMNMYGLVQHAFTNPKAHDHDLGLVYNERAASRAWQAMSLFLKEVF